jgi:Fur family transcriptional regulator, stress-responsive regulator
MTASHRPARGAADHGAAYHGAADHGAADHGHLPAPAEALRGAGLRVTAARVALIETVRAGDHLGAEAIAAGVRERVGQVSLQAVYDALHAVAAAGLVRRIEPAGSPVRYEGRVGDNHHHVACRACGVVADVACATGEAPCLTASDDHGFAIDEAEVIYWGLCPGCSAARDPWAPRPALLRKDSHDREP